MIPVTGADLLPALPALVLMLGAIILLLSEVFLSSTSRAHQPIIAVLFTAIAGVIAFSTAFEPSGQVFGGLGVRDAFSSFITVVVCIGLALALLSAVDFLRHRNAERAEFYALMLFAAAGMSLLAMSAELITLFINLEALSIATYALSAYLRRGTRPAEAGFKYFILGAFSGALLLYGAALLYGATGTTKLYDAAFAENLRTALSGEGRALVLIAVGLLGAGFAFKVAAVPFHMWTPDVYEGAPTPVTSLMSVGVKAAAFAAMVRVIFIIDSGAQSDLLALGVALLALLTMVAGNLLALPQRNVKRMLAYSSIAHAGYVLLGVAAMVAKPSETEGVLRAVPLLSGAASPAAAGLRGILYYLLAYGVTAVGAFALVGALERREDEEKGTAWDLDKFAGLAQRRPLWAVAMTVFMLSLGGIPPTVGFLGKLFIFGAAVDAGYVGLAVIGVLASAAGVYYYLRVVVYMYMRPAPEGALPIERAWSTELALALSTVAVIALGLGIPGPLTSWLNQPGLLFGGP